MVRSEVVARKIATATTLLDHARIHDESREGIEHLRKFLVLAADRAGL
jgi:hypothetical protein